MRILTIILFTALSYTDVQCQEGTAADPSHYLDSLKTEMQKQWPGNRTINLVFHGHSVPAGYFKTPVVNSQEAYPNLVLRELKKLYPYAVINVIVTAIGGENSISGEERFERDVLVHKPDVLFIDYALNDRGPGLEKAKEAWQSMINKALKNDIKIILLTPSPDQNVNILEDGNILEQHEDQIIKLAKNNGIGLVDSYALFRANAEAGENVADYMSQVNHPNEKGHRLIAESILLYF